MCVIIYAPPDKEVSWAILQNAVNRNSDGNGVLSVAADGKVTVVKCFGFPDVKRYWKEFAGTKRVLHARIGTSGKKDIPNCHPFACHYRYEDDSYEERWFFHNGCVAIPRFMDDMNDSWHLAQYITAFPTGPELHKALETYAVRENSRFVMVAGGEVYVYGKAWFMRDGVAYSNTSALANIEYTGVQGFYEGGLLASTAALEVTCDTHYSGLAYDPERKLYSNKATPSPKAPASQEYTPRRRAGGNYGGNSGGYGAYNRWGEDEVYGYDDKWIDELDKRRRENLCGTQKPRTDYSGSPRVAPWFRTNWGMHGTQQSWPNMAVHDYTCDEDEWHTVTMRDWTPRRNFWEQRTYVNGKFISTEKVEGPYENGLTLTVGNPNEVIYDGVHMSMTAWKELVTEFTVTMRHMSYADYVEAEGEMTDETVIDFLEGLPEQPGLEMAELIEEANSRLVPTVMLNGDTIHIAHG